jgi:hypothetical protein
MTAQPQRGDVGLAEGTRDPIFLLQSRRYVFNQGGIPDGIGLTDDSELCTDASALSGSPPDEAASE